MYLDPADCDVGITDDHVTFREAMDNVHSHEWLHAMKDKLNSEGAENAIAPKFGQISY